MLRQYSVGASVTVFSFSFLYPQPCRVVCIFLDCAVIVEGGKL